MNCTKTTSPLRTREGFILYSAGAIARLNGKSLQRRGTELDFRKAQR